MKFLNKYSSLLLVASLLWGIAACGDDASAPVVDFDKPTNVDPNAPVPEHLASFNLFDWNAKDGFQYHKDVIPYDLNTPLFSDYALKHRAIYIPDGTTIQYDDNDVLDFPVGTVILKTFYFAEDTRKPEEKLRLIETRVLILHEDGWNAYPYVWNDAQTEAILTPAGQNFDIDLIDTRGETRHSKYRVPSRNECQQCHLRKDEDTGENTDFLPIGPKARHLNRDFVYADGTKNQLEYLKERGWLQGLPEIENVPQAFDFNIIEEDGVNSLDADAVNKAAKDYLDINCAHCHAPTGVQGISSQFYLNHDYNGPELHTGVCKEPGSAGNGSGGHKYDIVPSSAEQSVLYYRIQTEERGKMMPVLARSLEHTEGVELVKAWIDNMEPNDKCLPK